MGASEKEFFKFPDCWNDDVRMTALFATPRNESINPHDWAGKYKFWRELILQWATSTGKLVLDIEVLNNAFCRKGKHPASLGRVLEEMSRQGDITTRDQYDSCKSSNASWTSWGIGLVKTSVSWSWNKVMSSLTEVEKGVISYVVPSVLEEMCDRVMELPEAASDEVIELEELTDLYPDLFSDDEETQIILNQLQKTGRAAVDSSASQTMVKFLLPTVKSPVGKSKPVQQNCTPIRSKSPVKANKEKLSVEITEVDRSLATLKRTEKLLADEINELEDQMVALEQTARSRLREGARAAAKTALYRRKQLQAVVDKRNQALVNIQTMKLQLSQAKTDSKIMEAYKIGLSALKNSFGELPLNEDKVQDTLFELETVLEQHRDIEDALAHGITSGDEASESDLEEELKNILSEAESSIIGPSEKEPELELPSVPTESPKAKETSKAYRDQLPAS